MTNGVFLKYFKYIISNTLFKSFNNNPENHPLVSTSYFFYQKSVNSILDLRQMAKRLIIITIICYLTYCAPVPPKLQTGQGKVSQYKFYVSKFGQLTI